MDTTQVQDQARQSVHFSWAPKNISHHALLDSQPIDTSSHLQQSLPASNHIRPIHTPFESDAPNTPPISQANIDFINRACASLSNAIAECEARGDCETQEEQQQEQSRSPSTPQGMPSGPKSSEQQQQLPTPITPESIPMDPMDSVDFMDPTDSEDSEDSEDFEDFEDSHPDSPLAHKGTRIKQHEEPADLPEGFTLPNLWPKPTPAAESSMRTTLTTLPSTPTPAAESSMRTTLTTLPSTIQRTLMRMPEGSDAPGMPPIGIWNVTNGVFRLKGLKGEVAGGVGAARSGEISKENSNARKKGAASRSGRATTKKKDWKVKVGNLVDVSPLGSKRRRIRGEGDEEEGEGEGESRAEARARKRRRLLGEDSDY